MIVRMEVQATPTIDVFGEEKYYWKVYKVVEGLAITIQDGFEGYFFLANRKATEVAYKYI